MQRSPPIGRARAGCRANGLGATYHRFDSDRLSLHYGNELDVIASAKVKRYTAAIRYARYRADKFATDTDKVFVTVDWVY